MNSGSGSNFPDIPFQPGEWLFDRSNPGKPGQYMGAWRKAGPQLMLQLRYPDGSASWRPIAILERMPQHGTSLIERLEALQFGGVRDLQRLITYEKLRGTLHEVIYSMEAAEIDFYPYQFKPVLKFINSPTERLIIADEVGLGKTIESALIWTELQARRQAKRLLVVCPKVLAEKWRSELRSKFLLDARTVDFRDLEEEMRELRASGPAHQFVLVASYSGLRPPKAEVRLLDKSSSDEIQCSAKTDFLRGLRQWSHDYSPFDLVIFDEAHYMRNPATTTFHLGESLATSAGAVLCVSATPVNNTNTDLHSLLRLIDESFFETEGLFNDLLQSNRPTVQAGNALARVPVDEAMLRDAVKGMSASRFISKSPLFKQLRELLDRFDPNDKARLAKCQDLVEKLNLLGSYVNRTRRVQVKENRPLRDPRILSVEYSPQERRLYNAILTIVRRKCQRDKRPFHVFQALGLHLRAASCLPVLAQEIQKGRFGNLEELLSESLGDEITDGIFDNEQEEEWDADEVKELLDYDFEANNGKYRELERILRDLVPNEKVVVFAYYRPTLAYLRRRLAGAGISTTVIHGGVPNDQRWQELERFQNPRGSRILLSSEVGSEGIDLQFCRVIVNYDLPWNPMRVEQRIGRIDRVGQQARRLSIVNFKVKDTIEERLFDRLHAKLERFSNSLGDLEAVIGREVQKLTIELLSKNLSSEEEQRLMEQSDRVIEERLVQIQALEESGDALIAFSDYVQKKITEDRDKGRYIQPEELEDYVTDFFEREFQGSELAHNTPADGCLQIRWSTEAQASLADFIRDDRSISARPLRQREFAMTFRWDVLQRLAPERRRMIHFVNHLSPLMRWITKINRERAHNFYNVSALAVNHPTVAPGDYCYLIERWRLKGLSARETMAYSVALLDSDETLPGEEAESVLRHVLLQGSDWVRVGVSSDVVSRTHTHLERELGKRFDDAATTFCAENETARQIKGQRVKNIFDRRISQDERTLKTLRQAKKNPSIIRATEGRLRTALENKEKKLAELDQGAQIDMERTSVAAGVFRVSAAPKKPVGGF